MAGLTGETRDRDQLRALLRRAPELHVYELGDLDDRFWPHTRWFVRGDAVALVYSAPAVPVLVALGDGQPELLGELVAAGALPRELYAHLSPGLADVVAARYAITKRAAHAKMALRRPVEAATAGATALAPADAAELAAFYAGAYPGNWFDPSMLDSGHYVGIREAGRLVAAAGVHVYSAAERVAALGNIAVAVAARGRGLAGAVTAAACASLRPTVDTIGLNVKADNAAAIAAYARVGFAHVAPYEEVHFVVR